MKPIPLAPSGEGVSRQAAAPVFERVGIVGLGPAGRALGLAIRRTWPSALVVGVDANDALERAMREHAIDVGGADLMMLNGVDLIVLGGRAEDSAATLEALEEASLGPAVVTATCGESPALVDAARRLPARFTFVAGLSAADGVWRLQEVPSDLRTETTERLRAFVAALGAQPPAGAQSG